MKMLRMRKNDGTTVEVAYKPTSNEQQGLAVARWLIKEGGRRPAEAAMEVAGKSAKQLRRLYQNLILTGKINQ
jgi:hypothetical protein